MDLIKMRLKPAVLLLSFMNVFAEDITVNQHNKFNTIRVVCTAALIPKDYEKRKRQYIHSLQKLNEMGCDVYVVESCQKAPTFLDDYCRNVCYTQSNNPNFRNYGINEAISLNIGLQSFKFDPEDMIIKLTGRYALETDEFIRLVVDNPQADAIVRTWNEFDAYTGVFAIRLKYFIDFLNSIDISKMHQQNIAFEHLFGPYITQLEKRGGTIVHLPRVYDYLPVAVSIR